MAAKQGTGNWTALRTKLSAMLIERIEAGKLVLPAMPAFYQLPRTLDDLADFMAGKILSALGLEHGLYPAWTGQVER